VTRATRFGTISDPWNRDVHSDHTSYIRILRDDDTEECECAIRMLARWWIRTLSWLEWEDHKGLFALGGEDRICMRWFHDWVAARMGVPLFEMVKDLFEQLIFAQHIRVALSRFDGSNQRLRFLLGDGGIVPTRWAIDKLAGNEIPGWTADRLGAFASLLCDLGILAKDEDGRLSLGDLANGVA
jgi:hypothetical protein